jgi:hypothetical protein
MSVDRAFVERNRVERERLSSTVARLTDAELGRSLGEGWTVAIALAHIAFWDRRALILLNKWEKTGARPAPSPVDVDTLNDTALYQARLLPPRVAAEEAVAAAEAVDRKIEALTLEQLAIVIDAETPGLDRAPHRRSHLDEIERTLATQSLLLSP